MFTHYWQRVDMCKEHSWNCAKDKVRYRQIVEKKRKECINFYLSSTKTLMNPKEEFKG